MFKNRKQLMESSRGFNQGKEEKVIGECDCKHCREGKERPGMCKHSVQGCLLSV